MAGRMQPAVAAEQRTRWLIAAAIAEPDQRTIGRRAGAGVGRVGRVVGRLVRQQDPAGDVERRADAGERRHHEPDPHQHRIDVVAAGDRRGHPRDLAVVARPSGPRLPHLPQRALHVRRRSCRPALLGRRGRGPWGMARSRPGGFPDVPRSPACDDGWRDTASPPRRRDPGAGRHRDPAARAPAQRPVRRGRRRRASPTTSASTCCGCAPRSSCSPRVNGRGRARLRAAVDLRAAGAAPTSPRPSTAPSASRPSGWSRSGIGVGLAAAALGNTVVGWIVGPLGVAAVGAAVVWREADETAAQALDRRGPLGRHGPGRRAPRCCACWRVRCSSPPGSRCSCSATSSSARCSSRCSRCWPRCVGVGRAHRAVVGAAGRATWARSAASASSRPSAPRSPRTCTTRCCRPSR